jgi:broad specificity phosphatase PhoE
MEERYPSELEDFTRIFLIRHGSAYDESGLQAEESGLNEFGIWQSGQLAERLKGVSVDKIYSSPTARALETAEIVAKNHNNKEIVIKEELQELMWEFWPELGHFHYDLAHEITKKLGNEDQLKMLGAVQKKGLDILAKIYKENPGKTVLVFTHGNLIRAIISAIMESGMRGFLSLTIDLASVTILDLNDETYRIVTVSDGCHTLLPVGRQVPIKL